MSTSYRTDVPTWDEAFMLIALAAAQKSRDPNTQVGACIASPDNRPVAFGYNGFPRSISNDKFPWVRKGKWLNTKYPYMCHAEQNAIDNRGSNSLKGCRIYVTLFPCNNCAQRIIQNGITEVIYLLDKYAEKDEFIAAKKMFEAAGINTRQLLSDKVITLDLRNG